MARWWALTLTLKNRQFSLKIDENPPNRGKVGCGPRPPPRTPQVPAKSSPMAFLKRGGAAFPKRPGGAPDEDVRARGVPSERSHMKGQIIWGNREKRPKIDKSR